MSVANSVTFPIKNQAWVLGPIYFYDNAGNVIVAPWTAPATTISLDGSTAASGSAVTQVTGTAMGFLALSAAQMNSNLVLIECTITNANAQPRLFAIYPLDMALRTNPSGSTPARADVQTLLLFEQFVRQAWEWHWDPQTKAGSTITLYAPDGTTVVATEAIASPGPGNQTKGIMQ